MNYTPKIYKMRIVFRWQDNDTEHPYALRGIKRMVLDSGLPYEPSKFVSSLPRLAYGPALAKGQRAEREYLDIYLLENRDEKDVCRALMQTAPKGFEIVQLTRVPYPLPSVQNLAAAARYRVKGNFSPFLSSGRKLEMWNEKRDFIVTLRDAKGMARERNITQGLVESCVCAPDEIKLLLAPINGQWISPQWFIAAWAGLEVPLQDENFAVAGLVFIRQELCWRDSQGEFHPI